MDVHTDSNPFPLTNWEIVIDSNADDTEVRERALEELCRRYWTPLYAYARRLGHNQADSEDLTQGFLTRMLNRKDFGRAKRNLGTFRAYIRQAFRNYIADHHKRAKAKKRGGDAVIFSIDKALGEDRYQEFVNSEMNPDELFDQHFAISLLERALDRLRKSHEDNGKANYFSDLQPFLDQGNGDCPAYTEVAARLSLSEAAVKSAIHRFRGQYRKFVLEEVKDTLGSDQDPEGELRYLLGLFN